MMIRSFSPEKRRIVFSDPVFEENRQSLKQEITISMGQHAALGLKVRAALDLLALQNNPIQSVEDVAEAIMQEIDCFLMDKKDQWIQKEELGSIEEKKYWAPKDHRAPWQKTQWEDESYVPDYDIKYVWKKSYRWDKYRIGAYQDSCYDTYAEDDAYSAT